MGIFGTCEYKGQHSRKKVFYIYSFKSDPVRAEIKQVREVVYVRTLQQDWDMQGKDKEQNAI